MQKYLPILFFLFLFGCAISPVPKNIKQMHYRTQIDVPAIESMVQPGDVIFRLSHATILGGTIDFSKIISELSDSDFSHAAIIYDITKHGVIIADVSVNGIELRFMRDWYIDQTTNVVIKRLKPEYLHLRPKVLDALRDLVERDVLYDEKFQFGDDYFYCSEVVDHCFREAGIPLAEPIAINSLPNFNWVHVVMALIGGISKDQLVVVAGNDEIGLFSSDKLEIVIDLRATFPN